jgi:hypothetical protein
MNETREQEFAESLKDSVDKIERYLTVMDSGSNVIDMFDPKKLH